MAFVKCPNCEKQINNVTSGIITCPYCGYKMKISGANPKSEQTQEKEQNTNQTSNAKKYVVLQVTLKERLVGTSSRNLSELENVINAQAAKGYRLHTITTASANSTGFGGGDRIQATMVFEKI